MVMVMTGLKMTARAALWAAIFLFPHASAAGKAAPPAVISEGNGEYPLGYSMQTLEDKEGKWTIEDVRSDKIAGLFAPLARPFPAFGHSKSAHWLRMDIQNAADKPFSGILEEPIAWIGSIDIHIVKPGGGYDMRRSGARIPFAQREIAHRSFLFHLDFYPQERKTIYVRLESNAISLAPFTLWSAEAFAKADAGRAYYFGFIFGAMALMILHGLAQYFFTRDDNHLWYIAYLSGGLAYTFSYNGFSQMALWPGSPWLAQVMIPILCFAFQMGAVQFTRRFLDTPNQAPGVEKLLWRFIPLYAALILIRPLGIFVHAINVIAALTALAFPPLLAGAGAVRYMEGVRPARLLTAAWLVTAIGMILGAAAAMGWTSLGYLRGGEIGALAGMALLGMALMDRANPAHMARDT
jgi:hypothetical protein